MPEHNSEQPQQLLSEEKLLNEFNQIINDTESESATVSYMAASSIFKTYFKNKQKEGLTQISLNLLIQLCTEIRIMSEDRLKEVYEQQKQAQIRYEESVKRVTQRMKELHENNK